MNTLLIGIDSGGSTSKLKARSDDGLVELSLISAGANPKRVGFTAAADRLAELIARCDSETGGSRALVIQIGAAGVGSRGDRAQLAVGVSERVSTILGNDRLVDVEVCTDAELALMAAFGGDSGVVIIAGTGSISICRTTNGDVLVRGGWGFRLGDEGGGYHIGLAALKHLASDFENGWSCELTRHVANTFGLASRDDLISFVYDQDRTAEVAPFVIQAAGMGDDEAGAILDGAVAAIGSMLVRISNTNADHVTPRYVLAGGLFREPHYRDRVHGYVKQLLPDWARASPRLGTAVDAAVEMARTRPPLS